MKKKKYSMESKMARQYMCLVLPGIIIFTIGLIIPLILAIRYSLTNWDGMSAEKTFVGFQNYIDLMKDSDFWNAWWFTIKFTIGNTIIQNVVALLFAVALDSGIKAQKIYRTVFFIPCLISAVIVGLQSVPAELYEAAKVDGAGPVKRFFNVTIPMLAPSITICVVGITTGSLKVYDLLVSSTKGGPGRASTSMIYQTYTTAINGRQYGYGCAMSVTLVIVLLLVAFVQVKGLRSKEVQA